MKRICLGLILLALLLSGCTDAASGADKSTSAANTTTAQSATQNTSLQALVMREKSIVGESDTANLTFIPTDAGACFLLVRQGTDWADTLWYLKANESTLTEKRKIADAEGAVVKYNLIQTSQGDFLALELASHQGNGESILLDAADGTKKAVFADTIDAHREDFVGAETVRQFGLPTLPGQEVGYGYSFVYTGGSLSAVYSDINKDGHTDALFYGIRELHSEAADTPIRLVYVERAYLYDAETGQFMPSQKLSVEQVLHFFIPS